MDASAGEAQLAELFRTEVQHVFGFLLWRCGSRSIAEDLTGQTFLEAAREAERHGAGSVSRGWLLTVARRRLIDHWRASSSLERRYEALRRERRPEAEVDGDPEGHVASALGSLSARQRAVLVLRYLDDYSVSELAEHLGISYRATESLLARARRSFADAYERVTSGSTPIPEVHG